MSDDDKPTDDDELEADIRADVRHNIRVAKAASYWSRHDAMRRKPWLRRDRRGGQRGGRVRPGAR